MPARRAQNTAGCFVSSQTFLVPFALGDLVFIWSWCGFQAGGVSDIKVESQLAWEQQNPPAGEVQWGGFTGTWSSGATNALPTGHQRPRKTRGRNPLSQLAQPRRPHQGPDLAS